MGERLTQGDIDKIQAEIDERKLVLRPKLLEEVKETRAQGDLSENFEYHEAKRAKNMNDSRIRYLEKMLKFAEVVDDSSADDEVGINNTVSIYIPEDDCEETYKLVTSIRGNSLKGLISIESPLGAAIRGKHVGDRAMVKVNDDYSYEVEIRKIDNSTTDEDDQIKRY